MMIPYWIMAAVIAFVLGCVPYMIGQYAVDKTSDEELMVKDYHKKDNALLVLKLGAFAYAILFGFIVFYKWGNEGIQL